MTTHARKTRASTSVLCPRCGGSGRIEMSSPYAEALVILRAQVTELNGADLARLAGCNATAMCQRLHYLRQQGLAAMRTDGRQNLWRRT